MDIVILTRWLMLWSMLASYRSIFATPTNAGRNNRSW
jgi:hypothetical protein